ncbi:MAG: metal ABC transporter permease [Rhizobiales bacterium]|nr:metal ABC transporter permease [Hyphomicrobiales bacterium]
MGTEFVQLSLVPMVIASLAAVACALAGNFLVLRRQALVGDAISHVVLPGIVGAFLVTGTVSSWPMLIGAGLAALLAVALIETIRRLGRVEPGAAMAVTFTSMFAAGVLVLEQTDTSSVHLDVEHALYGNVESLIWIAADGWGSIVDPAALADLPPELARMALVCGVLAVATAVFWRPLKIATFDEPFAASLGLPVGAISIGLVAAAAVAAVAAFDAVGSIIVIAMFICPPGAARLMTDRLARQVAWSVVFAVVSALAGYVLAGYGPLWLGYESSVSAAGMIATVSGLILALAALAGPRRRRVAAPATGA